MLRFFCSFVVRGDGSEVFVRSFARSLRIDSIKEVLGEDAKISYTNANN